MTDLVAEPKLNDLVPTLRVGDMNFESKLQEDLYVNRSDLNNEFIKHPERYAFYATCYEIAADRENNLNVNLERLYAILDHEKRGELAFSGVKVTEKMIENSVITDDRYVALQNEHISAQRDSAICKAAMIAMQHRRDMLIQLGSSARAEFNADVSLRAAAVSAKAGT